MKICYLGSGSWGYCLATLLSEKGFDVSLWTTDEKLAKTINETKTHPRFCDISFKGNLHATCNLKEALLGADLIVESVTSAGIRPVFNRLKEIEIPNCPIVLTSKGIEQETGKLLSEVVIEVIGEHVKPLIGSISGPSYADEVIRKMPTSVVGTAYDHQVMMKICDIFSTPFFRVYPNDDIRGVAYGGALKNIIAIACGASFGLGMGHSTRAALMTRGLHEIAKLAISDGCKRQTLYGLSGMGDLCVTCVSEMSRNFRFGSLLAKGYSIQKAKEEIGMVVEGAYTAVSALLLSKKYQVPMPITEIVYQIIYEGMDLKEAVPSLMQRQVKAEYL